VGLPCLILRQACHHFDGERVATVAVAVATTLEDRGEQVVSAGERSDAQVRDKSVEVFRKQSVPMPSGHRRAHVCILPSLVYSNLATSCAVGGVCLVDAMSVINLTCYGFSLIFTRETVFQQRNVFIKAFALFGTLVAWFRSLRPFDLLALEPMCGKFMVRIAALLSLMCLDKLHLERLCWLLASWRRVFWSSCSLQLSMQTCSHGPLFSKLTRSKDRF